MTTFTFSLIALVLGYFLYGKTVERIFAPDSNRKTPAISMADGVDYIPLPGWKIFMIQFLNIAGTGPIFGAILGAKFGPAAYLWIILGCIFAGAVHDYLIGMLSVRHGGANLPELVGTYLGRRTKTVMLYFSVFLLLMVAAVFVYSPAEILSNMGGSEMLWIAVIFIYYALATMLPIDKIIGRFYPVFAFALLFMAAALMVVLFIKRPVLPELWDGIGNLGAQKLGMTEQLFPCLFITIACGAISGFHGTQSPLMARCLTNEKQGRRIFYGSMIAEGVVALVWATVAMYFFYNNPQPGYELLNGVTKGASSSAPAIVTIICQNWLGVAGSILAILGVVAAPITSGDTALRSARLIIAEALHLDQKSIVKRFYIAIPMFAALILLLLWHMGNPNGFQILWSWFGWSNQTLAVFSLWTATVYLVWKQKAFIITLIPALFMTVVCITFLLISEQAFALPQKIAYTGGAISLVIALGWFVWWYSHQDRNNTHKQ